MGTLRNVLAALIAVVSGSHGLAAPGELDAAFGENGLATFSYGSGRAVAQQPDGKLLIAVGDRPNFQVLRLNADGTRDSSFGSSGIASVDLAGKDQAADLALMPDGKIVVVGTANASGADSKFAVARLNENGTLDGSFDGDGRVLIDTGHSWQQLLGVISTTEGSIVVVGTRWGQETHDMVFMRLLNDGALDPTFGDSPGAMVVDTGINEQANDLIQMPDGKYLACGLAEIDELVYVGTMLAVRLNQDGSLDRAFGMDGIARLETAARGYPSAAEACVALADGTIVLAGWELREPGRGATLLVRLRSDGVRDTARWNDGMSALELGRGSAAHAIVSLDDDLAISGFRDFHTMWDLPLRDSYVARIDGVSGRLDDAFGHDGATILDFSHDSLVATEAALTGLIRQADGKLVAVGGTWLTDGWDGFTEITAARIDPTGGGHPGIAGFLTPWSFVETDVALSVRRTGGSTGTLLVDFQTVDRSALAPRDYTHTRGTLVWDDGDMEPKTINVQIAPVAATQRQGYFDVLLSPPGTHALNETRVFVPSVEQPSGASPSPSSTRPTGNQTASPGGGGAAGLETLLLLGAAALLANRRRIALHGGSRQGSPRRCMNAA